MATTSVVVPKVTKKWVTVDAIPFFSEVGAEEEFGNMDVMVRVSAASDKLTSRVPIDLVAVLDVSSDDSSMKHGAASNKPIAASRLDLVKRAMEFIVEQLDDGDRIAVVAFNNANNTVAESTSKLLKISDSRTRASAKEKIDKLQAKGGTAFKPGLEQAILGGRSEKNRPGFILLLSDGDDKSQVQWWNKKASDVRALLKQYPVHTFGLGAAHDAKPLFFIAQESGGTYSFVRDRHLGDVAEAMAVCLGGLKSIVAMDTRIQVRPGSEAVEIRGVGHHGTGFQGTLEQGTYAKFKVGTLYAGEVKSFIVKIYCKQCKDPEQRLLIAAGGRYKDTTSAAGAVVNVIMDDYELPIRRLAVVYPLQHMPNPTVAGMLARLKVLEKLDLFRDRKIDGSKQKTDAAKEEEKESAKQELLTTWRGLKPTNTRIQLEFVEELDKDITAMANDLAGDRHGAAYLYSWLSSYNMQRATTMGSPDKVVAAFLTRAMKDEREAARKKKKRHQLALADEAAAARVCMCRFLELDPINKRLEFWGKKQHDVLVVSPESVAAGDSDVYFATAATSSFRDESLERINRQMYQDIFNLVVEQASKKKQCNCKSR